MLAKAAAVQLGIAPPTPLLTRLQGLRTIELGIVSGGVMLLVGLTYALVAVARWREAGFGELAPTDSVRIVVPAVTAGRDRHPARLHRLRAGDPRVRPRAAAQACPTLRSARRRAGRGPPSS